jgi:hypothetical protein
MTKAQRAAKALEFTELIGDTDPTCGCGECADRRRAFNRKLLTELLVPLMAEGGL